LGATVRCAVIGLPEILDQDAIAGPLIVPARLCAVLIRIVVPTFRMRAASSCLIFPQLSSAPQRFAVLVGTLLQRSLRGRNSRLCLRCLA
jgi:hypothetical protein